MSGCAARKWAAKLCRSVCGPPRSPAAFRARSKVSLGHDTHRVRSRRPLLLRIVVKT
jgi:hypothetical protein